MPQRSKHSTAVPKRIKIAPRPRGKKTRSSTQLGKSEIQITPNTKKVPRPKVNSGVQNPTEYGKIMNYKRSLKNAKEKQEKLDEKIRTLTAQKNEIEKKMKENEHKIKEMTSSINLSKAPKNVIGEVMSRADEITRAKLKIASKTARNLGKKEYATYYIILPWGELLKPKDKPKHRHEWPWRPNNNPYFLRKYKKFENFNGEIWQNLYNQVSFRTWYKNGLWQKLYNKVEIQKTKERILNLASDGDLVFFFDKNLRLKVEIAKKQIGNNQKWIDATINGYVNNKKYFAPPKMFHKYGAKYYSRTPFSYLVQIIAQGPENYYPDNPLPKVEREIRNSTNKPIQLRSKRNGNVGDVFINMKGINSKNKSKNYKGYIRNEYLNQILNRNSGYPTSAELIYNSNWDELR